MEEVGSKHRVIKWPMINGLVSSVMTTSKSSVRFHFSKSGVFFLAAVVWEIRKTETVNFGVFNLCHTVEKA